MGHEQNGWWFLTEQSAPLPQRPSAQGSTQRPPSQVELAEQSAALSHSDLARQPPSVDLE